VKIQRPGVREKIVEDLEALETVADFVDEHTEVGKRYEFGNMLVDLRRSLLNELDFKREAGNLKQLRSSLREFENIIIPEPVEDFTTSRVLTMDYIPGKKITSLSPLRLLEIDGAALSQELFRAYLKQMLVDGFFHADPHPGNVFLTDDDRIALLDLGMVGQVPPNFQENLLRLPLNARFSWISLTPTALASSDVPGAGFPSRSALISARAISFSSGVSTSVTHPHRRITSWSSG